MTIGKWDITFICRKRKWWRVSLFTMGTSLTWSFVAMAPFVSLHLLKHKGLRHLGNIPYAKWPSWIKRLNLR